MASRSVLPDPCKSTVRVHPIFVIEKEARSFCPIRIEPRLMPKVEDLRRRVQFRNKRQNQKQGINNSIFIDREETTETPAFITFSFVLSASSARDAAIARNGASGVA